LKKHPSKKAKSIHPGIKSELQVNNHERALLAWVFEQGEMGIAVIIVSILLKTAAPSRDFKVKPCHAQYLAICRFVGKYGLEYSLGTRES